MKGQSTRERIILAAVELLARGGIRALTSSELVRVSGVSKGGLYHHFSSMDAVLQTAAQACLQRFEWLLAPAEGKSPDMRLAEVRAQHSDLLKVLLCLHAEASFDAALKHQLQAFWAALNRDWQQAGERQARITLMLGLLTDEPPVYCSADVAFSAACKSA